MFVSSSARERIGEVGLAGVLPPWLTAVAADALSVAASQRTPGPAIVGTDDGT